MKIKSFILSQHLPLGIHNIQLLSFLTVCFFFRSYGKYTRNRVGLINCARSINLVSSDVISRICSRNLSTQVVVSGFSDGDMKWTAAIKIVNVLRKSLQVIKLVRCMMKDVSATQSLTGNRSGLCTTRTKLNYSWHVHLYTNSKFHFISFNIVPAAE